MSIPFKVKELEEHPNKTPNRTEKNTQQRKKKVMFKRLEVMFSAKTKYNKSA